MDKTPSKLPQWQKAPSVTLRRSPFNRYRVLIVLAICFLVWHRYQKPAVVTVDDVSLDEKISITYPEERERLVNRPPVANVAEEHLLVDSPTITPHEEPEVIDSPPSNPPEEHEGVEPILPPPQDSEDDDPQIPIEPPAEKVHLGISADKEMRSEEPEDDEAPEKLTGSNTKAKEGSEKHNPPLLVMEASQKLIGQHRSPAPKVDPDDATVKVWSEETGEPRHFPVYSEYAALGEKAEALPDIVHFSFEDSVEDVTLEGWEDLWFSEAQLNVSKYGLINETKIDFIYTWVNGSDTEFQDTIYPYEVNSSLNDAEGVWLESHRVNRYRDWDELRFSIRSIEKYASGFRNKIQLLVNSVANPSEAKSATVEEPAEIVGKQRPLWMKNDEEINDVVQILSQEDFFNDAERGCLPTFNSLTIENQIFNTKSDTDRIFALSDDMLLGKPHAASDIYSPLFGPTMGFKSNSYNTANPPTDADARRFGEKPFLIYTSWLLNRRFGERKRKGQIHFGHSISRSVTKEAINSFPRPALQSACQRFRGETGFQLYSWYVTFHYTMERHREALLWSYIMLRSDVDGNGNLGWSERQTIMDDLEEGMKQEDQPMFRKRMFYHMSEALEEAGLEAPKVNIDVQWTSLDGPAAIKDIECFEFNVNECIAPGFSSPASDEKRTNHVFSTASIFDRLARQHPKCGDCLLKLILNRVESGLSPLLPDPSTQASMREVVIKALWKYQYVIVEPDAFFVMVTDAEQVDNVLFKRMLKKRGKVGQLCLNDDVSTDEEGAVADVRKVMMKLLEEMLPEPSRFEI
ncbi:hypothetical protein VTL71DRAFT_7480 [Oculimacula yallundae]|uniref:Stealth protein CR1 conserved region 1 domain-containing protein n=1 Tax=Oculimacula yallundae TaxID=86028 RepID=A0ABR4BU80_9HELO